MKAFIHKSIFYLNTLIVLFLLSRVQGAMAQTCNGTWGPPIINQTFGQGQAGTNYYGPLNTYAPGATTSTNFVLSSTTDNWSCLSYNAQNGYPGSWVNKPDHTGNPYGLMFLINAPSTASTVFFEYTMNNLCPNTVLQFSVWILNTNITSISSASNYQYPNMQIKLVDASTGVQIASTNTGNVAADETWHNYTMIFNNGTSSSVKMQLVNNSIGSGYGNDLALDDITISPCVPVTRISPKLDTIVCKTSTFSFSSTITGNVYTNPEYLWQYSTDSGKTWQTLVPPGNVPNTAYTPPNAPGAYWVRFLTGPPGFSSNTNCVAVSDTSKILISKGFELDPVKDTDICMNGAAKLKVSGALSYTWSPATGLSCANCPTPIASPLETTTYRIIGSDNVACFDTTTLTVRVDSPGLTYNNVCPGEKGLAKAEITGGLQAIYTWYDDGDPVKQTVSTTGDTLSNLSPGGYIVNMHIDNVCDENLVFTIEEYEALVAAFKADPIMCIGQPMSVTNQSAGYTSLNWDLGNGTRSTDEDPTVNYDATGDFKITLIARNEHCADTATQDVSVREFKLSLTANGDTILYGQPIILKTTGSDDYVVNGWQPAESFTDQSAKGQNIPARANQKYTVWATSQYGCKDTADKFVYVKSYSFIPSAFTPNGDGKNDYFKPVIVGNSPWTCRVFDRWGKAVFNATSAEITTGWNGSSNGTPASIGVYYYIIEIETLSGIENNKGEVTLIR